MSFNEHFKKLKIYFYAETILSITAFSFILGSILYERRNSATLMVAAVVWSAFTYMVVRKTNAFISFFHWEQPIQEELLEKYFDRYGKRLINWILIAFLNLFSFVLYFVALGINSKPRELIGALEGATSFWLKLIAFFLIKNILIVRYLLKNTISIEHRSCLES